jgi:hypothetical protein
MFQIRKYLLCIPYTKKEEHAVPTKSKLAKMVLYCCNKDLKREWKQVYKMSIAEMEVLGWKLWCTKGNK